MLSGINFSLLAPASLSRTYAEPALCPRPCPSAPAGAMVVAAGTGSALLVGVEPLELGLPGVWYALGLLMTSRLATMIWRYQSATGPLPPSGVHRFFWVCLGCQREAAAAAAGAGSGCASSHSAVAVQRGRARSQAAEEAALMTDDSSCCSSSSNTSTSDDAVTTGDDWCVEFSNNAVELTATCGSRVEKEDGTTIPRLPGKARSRG